MKKELTDYVQPFLIFSLCLCLHCVAGVKRIDNYRKIKKEIKNVTCIINVDFSKVIYDAKTEPSLWEQIPSEKLNNFAISIISKNVKRYSKKNFITDSRIVKFNDDEKNAIYTMFDQLHNCKTIEQVTVRDDVLKIFDTISSDYILLICQNGYHYTKEYLNKVEAKEALQSLLSLASIGMAVASGGVGVVAGVIHDKGRTESMIALLEKQNGKVLYFTKRISRDDPLADSTMFNHVKSLFYGF